LLLGCSERGDSSPPGQRASCGSGRPGGITPQRVLSGM